jgi:hypothetical protein
MHQRTSSERQSSTVDDPVHVEQRGCCCISLLYCLLTAEESRELTVRARAAHRDVIRAQIILTAADSRSNAQIAADLRCHVDTVRKRRRRYCADRLTGLANRPRSGRPRQFTAVQIAEVKALACELLAANDTPLARWSCPDLALEATRRGGGSFRSVGVRSIPSWYLLGTEDRAIPPAAQRFNGRARWVDHSGAAGITCVICVPARSRDAADPDCRRGNHARSHLSHIVDGDDPEGQY